MFGPHLMLDCYGCDRSKLNDTQFILNFLSDTVKKLDMHMVKEPFLISYDANPETWDNGGVSAIVIIAESHISIHTFPENNGFMTLDMFSCKDFDIEKVEEIIKKEFAPELTEKHLLMRGRHFPKEDYQLQKILLNQRQKAEAVESQEIN